MKLMTTSRCVVLRTIGWTPLKCGTNIHVPIGVNCNNLSFTIWNQTGEKFPSGTSKTTSEPIPSILFFPRSSVRWQGLHRPVQLQWAVGAPLIGPEERHQPSLPAGLQLQGEWKPAMFAQQEQGRWGKKRQEEDQEKEELELKAPPFDSIKCN